MKNLIKKFDLLANDPSSNAINDLKWMAKDPAMILRRGNIKKLKEVKSRGYDSFEEMPEEEQKIVLAKSYYDPRYAEDSDKTPTESKYVHTEKTLQTTKWKPKSG